MSTWYNGLRYTPASSADHVESWFWRANHPTEPKAFWLKATILASEKEEAVAETWCCTFDGTTQTVWGSRDTVPFDRATFGDTIEVAGCRFTRAPDGGRSSGQIDDRSWDLTWTPVPGPLGEPLCMARFRRLIDGPFPKNKTLTPHPTLRFKGEMDWGGERVVIDDWIGSQGHNWGQAHAHTYAWGQCVFTDGEGEPMATAEAFSARILIAGRLTPFISALSVRHGGRTYHFNRLVDLWNQQAHLSQDGWVLKIRGPAGEAVLSMSSKPEETACLGYHNPDGHLSYCLNSKLARATLRVNPVNEEPFECHSDHSSALEFLQRDPDPRFPDVV